jgi:hypothetical protein
MAGRCVADTGVAHAVAEKAVGFGFIFNSQVKVVKRAAASASADGVAVGVEMTVQHRCGYDVVL